MKSIGIGAGALCLLALSACQDSVTEVAKPAAIVLTEEAAGHYCQMVILEHVGPKAQIHLAGYPAPFWFSQVRDGVAFLKSPEKTAEILAVYVNDMGAASDWSHPGANNWIDANTAHFVIGSDARGGMGAPEVVPFANAEQAAEFASERGGEVMTLADVPIEAVLAPVEVSAAEVNAGPEGNNP